MKKLTLTILIITFVLFALPRQTYAVWWNPSSWFSKNQQTQNIVAPSNNPQLSDTKTIEDLKAEVATLKTNLDNLYKAHDNLVNDHNTLLKYVNATISSGKNIGATTNNSNLDTRVTALENKLDDVCKLIFNFSIGCPSKGLGLTLEGRIKKLEGGF